jgi:hypothetical protein
MQALPLGDARTDAVGVGSLDVLASESSILRPTSEQVRPVERVATRNTAAVATAAALPLGVQASWQRPNLGEGTALYTPQDPVV